LQLGVIDARISADQPQRRRSSFLPAYDNQSFSSMRETPIKSVRKYFHCPAVRPHRDAAAPISGCVILAGAIGIATAGSLNYH